MSRVYLLDEAGAVIGRLDPSFQSLSTTRRWQGVDIFKMHISRQVLYGSDIEVGRFFWLPDGDNAFMIGQIGTIAEGSARNQQMEVSGRSVDGFALQERRVWPPVGETHDAFSGPAESALKHYMDAHAGPGAPAKRQLPGFTIEPDGATGPAVEVAARFQMLEEVALEIGRKANIGWWAPYDEALHEFVLTILPGVDRSSTVFFDFAFQTLERWEELVSILDSKTYVGVAGQGEGVARNLEFRWQGAEPEGFARREAFVDARDVELGEVAMLQQRGDAFLAAAAPERRLEATAHQYGSFKYRTDWDVGDIVLARHAAEGLELAVRVVEVTESWVDSAVAPVVTAALDRPFPTVQERMKQASSSSSGPIVDLVTGGGGGSGLPGGVVYEGPDIDDIHLVWETA